MIPLHRRMYAPSFVLRVTQMRFLPSVCAERGPVAETDGGTMGNGRGGASFFLRTRFGVLESSASAGSCWTVDDSCSEASMLVGAGMTGFGDQGMDAAVMFVLSFAGATKERFANDFALTDEAVSLSLFGISGRTLSSSFRFSAAGIG